jgi:hypothetical protein
VPGVNRSAAIIPLKGQRSPLAAAAEADAERGVGLSGMAGSYLVRTGGSSRLAAVVASSSNFDLEFMSFQVAEQPSLRLSLYTPADDGRSETTLREIVALRPAPSSLA